MKKTLVFTLLLAFQLPTTATQAEVRKPSDTVEAARRKVKPYRKKKGFLWGLFRKKSNCDCPKH